jgi:hypothetical protein
MNEKSLTEMTIEAVDKTDSLLEETLEFSSTHGIYDEETLRMMTDSRIVTKDWMALIIKCAKTLDEINNKLDRIENK